MNFAGPVTHTLAIQQPSITIELPGEPRGKGRPRFVRATGRTYTDALTAEYERNLRLMGAQAMAGRAPIADAVTVAVEAYHPIPASWSRRKKLQAQSGLRRPTTKPDCDNITKMLDALNTVVWIDDKQIVELTVAKHYSTRPHLRIEVRSI